MNRFLLGVNYWPADRAMDMWTYFDRARIAADFAQIAGLGLHVVRFFLRWDVFQPEPTVIDPGALAKLQDFVALAQAAGLRTIPTFFCGHMSGVNWLPSWTLDRSTAAQRFRTITESRESHYGIGDFYADERLLDAQRLQVRVVGAALRDCHGVVAWDLGNEFSNLRVPASIEDGVRWSRLLTAELASVASQPVTGGIHGEDVAFDRNLRPSSLCAPWGFATMHGYPAYSDFARSTADTEVVPFLNELVAGFARKPVMFTEFGNPACPPEGTAARCLDEMPMAIYATEVLERLHACGALGALWWCWSDYALELAAVPPCDLAPHELRFGLVRADGSMKPVAQALAAFARQQRNVLPQKQSALPREDAFYSGLPDSLNVAYKHYVRTIDAVETRVTGRKTLVITGASAGAGRALAERAVRAGYAVFGVGRRTALLDEVAATLRDAAGEFTAMTLELRTPNAARTIVKAALERFGRIDVLVNNAGAVATGRISEQSDDALSEQFTVHIAVPLALLREALPALRAVKGHVFFVGSGVARIPVGGLGAYPSAKAAIRSAARIARNELRGDGIAVTYVDPGAIATEFMTRAGMQGSAGPLTVSPHEVARKIMRAIATRPSHVDAVPWQTTLIGLSELVPRITDAVLAAAPGLVGAQVVSETEGASVAARQVPEAASPGISTPSVQQGSTQPAESASTATAPKANRSELETVLLPLESRMRRLNFRLAFVKSLLVPEARLDTSDVALRWAGMPNKNERSITHDVLEALAGAGFLAIEEPDRYRVVRSAN